MKNKIAIVGTGLSGAVIAQQLADAGFSIDIFDSRGHIGGNCYTERDQQTNILVHKYGPHIFHTDNKQVWDYINGFCQMEPYINRVKALSQNSIYSMPINLHTLNQFFKTTLSPSEAEIFLESVRDKSLDPQNFEEQAMYLVGRDLYEAFFKGYTKKQWGCDPTRLPASILKRLPLRLNYDDNYFNHKYQGIPKNGYTEIFEKLLDRPNIQTHLNTLYNKSDNKHYRHVFYSGPIDQYFDCCFGALTYRTLRFEKHYFKGDFQGCAVMNYCDENVPFTRISEHKHFAPWETHVDSVYYKEFSAEATASDIPFYPIGLSEEKALLEQYQLLAQQENDTSFIGRLGTYRYLDMDVSIAEAMNAAKSFLLLNGVQ